MKKILFLISFGFTFLSNIQSQDCSILTISNDTSVSLDVNGEAEVTPDMLMFGDISQCNYEIALSSEIDNNNFIIVIPYGPSITITCEFVGTYVVSVRDIDSGNLVWANLNIEDVIGACPTYFGSDTYSLIYDSRNFSGQIGTDVTLNGNLVDQVYDYLDTIPKSDLVDGENILNFPSISNSSDISSTISTLDIVEIAKMFVFDVQYPLQAVLADVDGSGYLNVNDIVLLREYILGFPLANLEENYLFVSKTYEFPADFDAFDFTDLNFREYKFNKDAVVQEDLEFFVYAYGNVSEVTDSFSNEEVSIRSSQKLILTDQTVTAGETIQVPMTLISDDFDIKGLQIGMALNGLELKEVNHNYSGNTLLHNYISDQDLRFSFFNQDGAEEFNAVLEFEILEDGDLKDMISLNEDFEQLVAGDEQHSLIDLEFQATSSIQELEEVSTKMIGKELSMAFSNVHTEAVFVYDVQGRVISSISSNSNLVTMDMNGLNEGMYFVSTMVNGKLYIQKIVLINN